MSQFCADMPLALRSCTSLRTAFRLVSQRKMSSQEVLDRDPGSENTERLGADALPGVGVKRKLTADERERRRVQARCCREVLKKQKRKDLVQYWGALALTGIAGGAGGFLLY